MKETKTLEGGQFAIDWTIKEMFKKKRRRIKAWHCQDNCFKQNRHNVATFELLVYSGTTDEHLLIFCSVVCTGKVDKIGIL